MSTFPIGKHERPMEEYVQHTRMKLAAACAALIALPAAAWGQDGEVTTDVHMRAGPGTDYPVVTTIPGGRDVDVYGCVSSHDWCDVGWANRRGWVFSDYIEYDYDDRLVPLPDYYGRIGLPTLSFSFGSYADQHYRGEPWYNDRDRWDHRRGHDGRGRDGDGRDHHGRRWHHGDDHGRWDHGNDDHHRRWGRRGDDHHGRWHHGDDGHHGRWGRGDDDQRGQWDNGDDGRQGRWNRGDEERGRDRNGRGGDNARGCPSWRDNCEPDDQMEQSPDAGSMGSDESAMQQGQWSTQQDEGSDQSSTEQ